MKKNRMMRIASVLLVAVLMSTCAISGTFAKYVTTVSGEDSARVAKWGIGSDLTNAETFTTTYSTDHPDSIVSNNGDKIVGPGAFYEGVYELNGTPEVAYRVSFALPKLADVFLKEGKYAIVGNDNKPVAGSTPIKVDNNGETYYPIEWTVTITTTNGIFTNVATSHSWNQDATNISGTEKTVIYENLANLTAVKGALDDTEIDFAANAECDVELIIAWDWAFDGQNDEADTVLGNIAAGMLVKNDGASQDDDIYNGVLVEAYADGELSNSDTVDISDKAYSCNVGYELIITAEQIQSVGTAVPTN